MKHSKRNFTFFWSGPFSQFAQYPIVIDGVTYCCNEQYMMASKARLFGDTAMEKKIMGTSDPQYHQDFGRLVRNYKQEVWDAHKREIVYRGTLAKFSQHDMLKSRLFSTGHTIIVEASPKDRIWGIGMDKNHPDVCDPDKWKGTNYLGEALMRVREELFPELTRLKLS